MDASRMGSVFRIVTLSARVGIVVIQSRWNFRLYLQIMTQLPCVPIVGRRQGLTDVSFVWGEEGNGNGRLAWIPARRSGSLVNEVLRWVLDYKRAALGHDVLVGGGE
jgi:hypothetical protein